MKLTPAKIKNRPAARTRRRSTLVTWGIVAGVWVFLIPFYYFDRMDLALLSVLALAAIGLTIATFWKHKRERWFWIAIVLSIAIHVPLIFGYNIDFLAGSKVFFGIAALIDYGLLAGLFKLVELIFGNHESPVNSAAGPTAFSQSTNKNK